MRNSNSRTGNSVFADSRKRGLDSFLRFAMKRIISCILAVLLVLCSGVSYVFAMFGPDLPDIPLPEGFVVDLPFELGSISVLDVTVNEDSTVIPDAELRMNDLEIYLDEETEPDAEVIIEFSLSDEFEPSSQYNIEYPLISSYYPIASSSVEANKNEALNKAINIDDGICVNLENGEGTAYFCIYYEDHNFIGSTGSGMELDPETGEFVYYTPVVYTITFMIGDGEGEDDKIKLTDITAGEDVQFERLYTLLNGDVNKNHYAFVVVPNGTDTFDVTLVFNEHQGVKVQVNGGAKESVSYKNTLNCTLNATIPTYDNSEARGVGFENTIALYAGSELLETYTIYAMQKRYTDLPDTVIDYLCVGSQYTNSDDYEDDYGQRAIRSLVGSNYDAGGGASGPVSLGNFGGYIVYYYDEAIQDDPNNPYGIDFIAFGNSVEGSNEFGEPGQVWVSENGEKWYALAGGMHYENYAIWDYEIEYDERSDGSTEWWDSLDNHAVLAAYSFPKTENYPLYEFEDPDEPTYIILSGIYFSPDGETNSSGNTRPPFAGFGYVDLGRKGTILEGEDASAWGEIERYEKLARNIAGNPYLGVEEGSGRKYSIVTDGMDLAWAVDSEGQPVALPNGVHYIKIVTASNIVNESIGEKSTEVNMVRVAQANETAVGVSTAPASISFDGAEVDLSKGTQISDNVFAFTGSAAVEVRGAFDVEVDAEGSNVYINNNPGKSAFFDKAPDHGIVRVIVQDGEKEPLIYVFSLDPKEASQEETDREAAEAVDRLIEAIGEVTLEKKDAIEKAQAAYEALTDAQKELVTKKAVLDAAVAALAELLAQDFGTVHVIVENATFTQATAAELGVEWKDDIYWSGVLVEEDVALTADSSMIGAVAQALAAKGFTQTGADTGYISEIHGLGEKDAGPDSGWMGMLNDWFTNQGFDAFTVANGRLGSGDEIHVVYSVTGLATENNDTSLAGLSASVGEFDKAFDPAATTYTLTVPAGTESVKLTPTAANKNFYVAIKAGDTEYKRTAQIPVADGTVIKLEVGAPSMNSGFTPTAYNVVVAFAGTDAVERVENLIDAIGEVTAASGDAILAARTAYDALTDEQKGQVSNYDTLTAAEAAYQTAVNAAVQNVEDLIAAIPDPVTLDSKNAITAARTAYDALTDEQKAQVENYEALVVAENALAKLEVSAEDIYTNTGNYIANLINTDETGLAVGSVGGEWAALGLARAGKDVPRKDEYLAKVEAFIAESINDSEQLHRALSTENSRLILALTAMGVDATSAYGHDLITGLSDLTFVKKQGINGPIWALIALDSHEYEVAEGATATREALIDAILAAQLDDGGWVLSSTATSADGDMTGMALQALAPYYSTNAEVKAAVDEALACLSAMQNAVGGFGSVQGGSATSESCAQVVVALTALGIDPAADERFVKNGLSVLDDLCSYYVEGGGFEHVEGGGLDGMATEQGYYALAAYFRFKDGQTSLYDMSDVTIGEDEPAEEGPIIKAVDEEGEEIEYDYEEIPEDILLTDAVAVSVNPDLDSEDEFTIFWQMDVTVPDGTEFPVTLTFAIPEEYQDQTIYVYHYNGTDWEVVGEGTGAEVSAEFEKLSPVGLVAKASVVPPTGDANDAFLWAGLCVMALAAAAYTVSCGRKRREE